jgi:competence protein ComEC
MFLPAISSAAGIACASSSYLLIPPFLISIFFYCSYHRSRRLFLSCIFFFLLFFFYFEISDYLNITHYKAGTIQTEAVIYDIPKLDGDRLSVFVETKEGEILSAVYYLKKQPEIEMLSKINPGTVCRVKGELKQPKNATVPGTFHYKNYLYQKKIHWIYQVDAIENCRATGNMQLKKIRKAGLDRIKESVPKKSAGIVQALLFGEQENLDPEIEEAYQQLGIIHILAISGLHVAILAAAIYFFLLRLGITRESAKLILIAALPFYALITGATPSVLRAVLMTMGYLLFSLIHIRLKKADVLCLVFLGLLLFDPYLLFQAGFQLSFAVTFFILLSKSIFQQYTSRLGQLMIVSLIAQFGSLPILLYHFQTVSLLSCLTNLLFVPFYTFLVLPFAFINFLFVIALPPLGGFLFQWFDLLIRWSH